MSDNSELMSEVAPFAFGMNVVVRDVEVVFPEPDGVWQLPSPRRKVVDEQEPVHSPVMSAASAADKAEVPLPLIGPVSEVAPVPPTETGTIEKDEVGEPPAPPPNTN